MSLTEKFKEEVINTIKEEIKNGMCITNLNISLGEETGYAGNQRITTKKIVETVGNYNGKLFVIYKNSAKYYDTMFKHNLTLDAYVKILDSIKTHAPKKIHHSTIEMLERKKEEYKTMLINTAKTIEKRIEEQKIQLEDYKKRIASL